MCWLGKIGEKIPAIVVISAATSLFSPESLLADSSAFDCVVEPSLVLDLGSSVAGLIDEVLVERGQIVSAGDVVARLRSDAERTQLVQARTRAESDAQLGAQQAALDLAVARSERIGELRDRSVVSEAQNEEVDAELRTAQMNLAMAELQKELDQIAVQQAEVNLDLRRIKSPINGIVTERNRGPGEYVFQETHVLTVAQIDPLYVRALLPVEFFRDTREGGSVQVALRLPEQREIAAEITVVDKILDAATGTFAIRAEIANPNGEIPGGQTCTLSLGAS